MPTPPSEEQPLDVGDQAASSQPSAVSPRGTASPVLQRRGASPRRAAGGAASAGEGARKFVDYRMEAAPTWDGEMPQTKYREYSRNLYGWWRQ